MGRGTPLLRAKVATKLDHLCAISRPYCLQARLPKPDPAHQSDGDSEAQRSEATSPGPTQQAIGRTRSDVRSIMPDLRPSHLTGSKSAGVRQTVFGMGP